MSCHPVACPCVKHGVAQEDVGGTFLDDEGEQPTAAELNAARQAHLAREHRRPQDKDMSYEEIERFVKVRAAFQPWQMFVTLLTLSLVQGQTAIAWAPGPQAFDPVQPLTRPGKPRHFHP